MSIIDAIMGKNMAIDGLTKSGGAGYADVTERKVTFNGHDVGGPYIDGAMLGMEGAKFLKTQIDPQKVSKIKSMTGECVDTKKGIVVSVTTYTEEQLNIMDEGGFIYLCSSIDGLYNVIIFKKDFTMEGMTFDAGVYFMYAYIEDIGQKNFISEFVYEEETVHTIESMYLEAAKPVFADLNEFTCFNGSATFNEIFLSAIMGSLQAGKAVQNEVIDDKCAFQAAVNKAVDKLLVVRMHLPSTYCDGVPMVSRYPAGDYIANIIINGSAELNGVRFSYTADLAFRYGGKDDKASLYCLCTPIG